MISIRTYYEQRLADLGAQDAALGKRSDAISRYRGFAFLAMAASLIGVAVSSAPRWAYAGAGLPLLVFVGLVVRHALIATQRTVVEEQKAFSLRGLARLDETEEPTAAGEEPRTGQRFLPADHPNASDLDLLGKSSLFQALSRAETSFGEETLAKWLLHGASPEEIRERHQAVKELMVRPDLLEELVVKGARAASRGRTDDPLVVWAEAPLELPVSKGATPEAKKRAPLIVVAKILVPLTILLFALGPLVPFLHLPPTVTKYLARAYVVPLVLQIAVLGGLYGPISRMITFVTSREAPLGKFGHVFRLIETAEFQAPMLKQLSESLRDEAGAKKASAEIAQLERIVSFADLRHNVLIHVLLNLGVLYDVWVALALDRWRARSGRRARGWLRSVGTLEALSSLALYAAEHPTYVFPEISDDEILLDVEDLGHPLISSQKRVVNTLRLSSKEDEQGAPAAILVTGSNMSGKSTWLRSMGLSVVMAMAGSVVAAKRAKIGPMSVWTSMRIKDSLSEGYSHFYAELVRLKSIQSAVKRSPRVLFLLDEILHGTNSRERTLGAKAVVSDLIHEGAIGAVSSHDLGLVALEKETHGRILNQHFSDSIEGDTMTFDYHLKEGVASSTNALRLMKLVGIEMPAHLESEPAAPSEPEPAPETRPEPATRSEAEGHNPTTLSGKNNGLG